MPVACAATILLQPRAPSGPSNLSRMGLLRRLAIAAFRPAAFIRLRSSLGLLAQATLLAAVLIFSVVLLITWMEKLRLLPEPRLTLAEAREIALSYPLPTRNRTTSIVKRVHFMYRGFLMNAQFRNFLASWRMVYPDYQMYFWTDAEIDLLIGRLYPAWQDMYYRQLSNYMERSDTARAFILDALGGWYADLDTGCLSRADELATRYALILPLEPYLHALNNFRIHRMVSNAIMYSVPDHPFWTFYLHRLRDSLIGKRPRESTIKAPLVTGPVLLTEVALMFLQAHNLSGCPQPWCPHLAPPVQFLPIYDNSTLEMWLSFRRLCRSSEALSNAGFADECRRFEPHNFRNHPPDARQSHTYHAFLHLNQRTKDSAAKADVRDWGLDLTVGSKISDEIDELEVRTG